jgi:hypothetical protein
MDERADHHGCPTCLLRADSFEVGRTTRRAFRNSESAGYGAACPELKGALAWQIMTGVGRSRSRKGHSDPWVGCGVLEGDDCTQLDALCRSTFAADVEWWKTPRFEPNMRTE